MRGARELSVVMSVGVIAVIALSPVGAAAAPGDRAGVYSTWTAAGGGVPTAASLTPGFPSLTIASDDPALSVAATATLTASSPPGGRYGSSSSSQHLSLHPLALGGGAWAPTTTTLTFESPTPGYGWSFVLGDIDSESVIVSATGPAGPVPPGDLGFVEAFDPTPPTVLPVWDPLTATLAAPTGDDTAGANAWFSPSVPLTSISVTSIRRQGSPTVYLWLAAQTASLSGTVLDSRTATPTPASGANVGLAVGGDPLPGGADAPSVVTDQAGAFAVDVFPTTVDVSATTADGAVCETVRAVPVETSPGSGLFVFASPVELRAQPPIAPAADQVLPSSPEAPTLPSTGVDQDAMGRLALGALVVIVAGAGLASGRRALSARRTAARIRER